MRELRTLFLILTALAVPAVLAAQDDGPSLGDVARQARLQKQKNAQTKDAQANSASGNAATNAPAATGGKDAAAGAASTGALSKDASGKASTGKAARKVVTNDEIPEHVGPTSTLPAAVKVPGAPDPPSGYEQGKVPAEYWKNQIRALKESISELESQIQDVSDSIRYAGGNCVTNCAQWNERQQAKQQQVEMMTAQLSQAQKSLEAMQETARKQGYGSSVYDP